MAVSNEEKRQLRSRIKALRRAVAPEEKQRWDALLKEQFFALLSEGPTERHQKAAGAPLVYLYLDIRNEAGTMPIIKELWKRGIRTAVPKVEGSEISFYEITDQREVSRGCMGILEPVSGTRPVQAEKGLVVVPGVAFDPFGGRMGYGGGFYDRFFQREPDHPRWGLAYDFQIVKAVPQEPWDRRMDLVITPGGVLRSGRKIVPEAFSDNTGQAADSDQLDAHKTRNKWVLSLQQNHNCRITGGEHMTLQEIGQKAQAVSRRLGILGVTEKNRGLLAAAESLIAGQEAILAANQKDMEKAALAGMSQGLLDRLKLTRARIEGMADGLKQVAALDDPVGEVLSMKQRPNGLMIGQKRVPLGVIGIIYEARPNVTADAFGLCFKSGNAVILKGGSDAICSNQAIVDCLQKGLEEAGLPADAVQLIADTNRSTTQAFMKLNQYVDVLIPRGGAGLIRAVVENSTIPVIETGTGNCHIYVDESADFDMALDIIFNAKTQRIGVCNACESLVIHRRIAEAFLPLLKARLDEKQVEIRGDQEACRIVPEFAKASEEDWGREYLDYIISCRLVDSVEEAIDHINRYNTKHSEAIITKDYSNAQKFLNEVDAAAVYVNASTRFTDGCEFGFGAEIGISTQKLHARGPMGLKELTTTKYIIYGSGQVRP